MQHVAAVLDAVRSRPLLALVATNAVTAGVAVYVISEGRPMKWLHKKLFQALMAVVPPSLVDAEQAKMKLSIEKEVVGHVMAGETVYAQLPAEGE